MSRIVLTCSFAALLAASGTQGANATQNANQSAWDKDRLACAEVGIDPGSAAFDQCVVDLHHSLWAEKNLDEY